MRKIVFFIFTLLLNSCGSINFLENGVYVNTNNVFNEYFIIYNDGTKFEYNVYNSKINGRVYNFNETRFLKTDSVNFYKNLKIDFKVSDDGNDYEHLLVELNEDSYKYFSKKHPHISLYFVGFLDEKYTISQKLSAGKNSITSHRNKNKINEFKLVGIYNSCYNSFDECDLMGTAFKTRSYDLIHSYWNPKLEINLNSIANKNLSQERFIKEIDTILNKHEFIFDNKKYVRFKTLNAFKGHSDESQFYKK